MTEMTGLLIVPEEMMYKAKRFNKCHYHISPYWNFMQFNARIIELKIELSHMNPLYLKEDVGFKGFVKKLLDSGVLDGLHD